MRWLVLLIAGLIGVPQGVAAQISERPDRVAVTVYHTGSADEGGDPLRFADPNPQTGLAFVSETRTIDGPAGPAVIEFRGVASTMIPQTVEVEGFPSRILERNFDFDLLSPGSLLAKSVGNTVV